MIKKNKDKTFLIGEFKLPVKGKHYCHIYIWSDKESMMKAVFRPDPSANGYHCCNTWSEYTHQSCKGVFIKKIPNKISEIHLIVYDFGVETVDHELMHLLFHYLRLFDVDINKIINDSDIKEEENLCYIKGAWSSIFWNKIYKEFPDYQEMRERLTHAND